MSCFMVIIYSCKYHQWILKLGGENLRHKVVFILFQRMCPHGTYSSQKDKGNFIVGCLAEPTFMRVYQLALLTGCELDQQVRHLLTRLSTWGYPQDPHGGRRQLAHERHLLTATHVPQHTYMCICAYSYTNTHTHLRQILE